MVAKLRPLKPARLLETSENKAEPVVGRILHVWRGRYRQFSGVRA